MCRKKLTFIIIFLFIGGSVCPNILSCERDFDKNEIDDYNILIKKLIKSGVLSNGNWSEEDKLLASDGAEYEQFGKSVSIDGETALVGAPDKEQEFEYGAAYVYVRSGEVWTQEAILNYPGAVIDSGFGETVSLDGDTAVIGACHDDGNEPHSGSAYVFVRSGRNWTQQAKLIASDGTEYDSFGFSVSIDGDTAIIGADGANEDYSGSAYVFSRSDTNWTEEAKLVASDGSQNDCFGYSVSIYEDRAVIGAREDDDNGDRSGSAYIFKRIDTNWNEEAKLLPSDGAEYYYFGHSVSIDGDYVVVGSPEDDDIYMKQGSAHVFIRSDNNWIQQTKLIPSDAGAGRFGLSVSIDNDYIFIGAPDSYENADYTGSVYVFNRSGAIWTQQTKLLASDKTEYDNFGWSVSLDGDIAVIGARLDDDNGEDSGSAYVFTKSFEPLHDLTVDGFSPIDLNITDTMGRFINKNSSNIPGATYTEEDFNGDGDLDDRVFIPDAIDGLYTIQVIPEPDSEPTDTFSIKATFKDVTYYIVEDELIQNIPPEGYNLSWPNKPSKPVGKVNGKVGESYIYSSNSIDPDGDDIFYLFDWGDGMDSGWLETGEASHSWSTKGNYNIRVKTKDTHGFESRWSDILEVDMPRNKAIFNTHPVFLWLIEIFPILRHLLGL